MNIDKIEYISIEQGMKFNPEIYNKGNKNG